jgi:predicted transcriptional regulator
VHSSTVNIRDGAVAGIVSAVATWTFLSNHAHVLVAIADDPDVRLRDIAVKVGITERAASTIVNDLEEAGYLTRSKVGRSNTYTVHGALNLRHPLESHRQIGDLLTLLAR